MTQQELHNFMIRYWNKFKRPVPEKLIVKFLVSRLNSLIETSQERGLIVKVPNTDTWLPRPPVS